MKVSKTFPVMISIAITSLLSGCNQQVTMESIVHPDGSLDRTILLTEADSDQVRKNFFGIHPGNGWNVEISPYSEAQESDNKVKGRKFNIKFNRHFSSVEELNQVFKQGNDTLFHLNSTFEKRFRWFYTYIDYSDTYLALNRFHSAKPSEFFTEEDYAFIDRLPAEGKSISHADSLYLDQLNKKIVDNFSMRAIFDEHYKLMLDQLTSAETNQKYIDDYVQRKEYMYSLLTKDEVQFDDDAFMPQLMDSLKWDIPLHEVSKQYFINSREITSRVNFMSRAAFEHKYTHMIKMPWSVTDSNADSIAGNTLFFKPPSVKFMLNDFTMHASARKLNYWALAVSGVLIIITIVVFFKTKSRAL